MLYFICFRKGRLSVDWKRIKAEYIAGGTSFRKLAEKYSVSFSTLRKVAAKEQWTQLRNNAGSKRDTVLAEKIGTENAKIDEKYYRLVDKLMSKAEETIDGLDVWSVTALKEMSTALKNFKECKDIKSEADKLEQTARIAKLQREAGIGDEGESGGVIVLPDANAPLIDEEDGCE
jgi:lambda repressor-like predicted transcriptional regulator